MNRRIAELHAELSRSPEDWSVRLRLIEIAVDEKRNEEAKRLVRESPGEEPLPPELQARIYELLTRNVVDPELANLPRAND